MLAGDAKFALAEFAERNRLRPTSTGIEYGGLCHGLGVLAAERRGTIRVFLFSPGIELTPDLILEGFRSFETLAAAGVPTQWISGNVLWNNKLDRTGCFIDLTPERLEQIPEAAFLRLPDLFSQDVAPFRASSEPIPCSRCASAVAQQLHPAEGGWQFRCDACSGTFEETEAQIRWGPAAAVLLGGTILFALVWGLIQQPSVRGHQANGLLMAPFIGAITLCRLIARFARGTSLPLRLITATCIVLAVFAGNIWGYRSWLCELGMGDVSWSEAITAYFRALPTNTNAGWYLLGGLGGAWIGFGILKFAPTPERSLPGNAVIAFPMHSLAIDDDELPIDPGS